MSLGWSMTNELKISFCLDLGSGLTCHEKDLIDWLPSLEDRVRDNPNFILLCGGVSIKHFNQELLGADYWRELNYLVTVGPAFLSGRSVSEFFTSISTRRGCALKMTPSNNLVHLEIGGEDEEKLERSVDLRKYFQEWELMGYRIIRLRMFLNDADVQDYYQRWQNKEWVNKEYLDIVGEDLIEYTLTADIEKVLQDPLNGSPR